MSKDSVNRLKKIKERVEKATEGPWCYENVGEKSNDVVVGVAFKSNDEAFTNQLSGELDQFDKNGNAVDYYREAVAFLDVSCENPHANANFIANAREDVPFLLEQIKEKDEYAKFLFDEYNESLRLHSEAFEKLEKRSSALAEKADKDIEKRDRLIEALDGRMWALLSHVEENKCNCGNCAEKKAAVESARKEIEE